MCNSLLTKRPGKILGQRADRASHEVEWGPQNILWYSHEISIIEHFELIFCHVDMILLRAHFTTTAFTLQSGNYNSKQRLVQGGMAEERARSRSRGRDQDDYPSDDVAGLVFVWFSQRIHFFRESEYQTAEVDTAVVVF